MSLPRVPSFSERPGFPAGLRVLLVEPNSKDCEIISAQLKECSYEVHTVATRGDAQEYLDKFEQDVDLFLCEASVVARKRLSPSAVRRNASRVPLVLMGENTSQQEKMLGIQAGAVDFLEKPLSALKLRNIWQHTVRKMMKQRFMASGTDVMTDVCEEKPRARALVSAMGDKCADASDACTKPGRRSAGSPESTGSSEAEVTVAPRLAETNMPSTGGTTAADQPPAFGGNRDSNCGMDAADIRASASVVQGGVSCAKPDGVSDGDGGIATDACAAPSSTAMPSGAPAPCPTLGYSLQGMPPPLPGCVWGLPMLPPPVPGLFGAPLMVPGSGYVMSPQPIMAPWAGVSMPAGCASAGGLYTNLAGPQPRGATALASCCDGVKAAVPSGSSWSHDISAATAAQGKAAVPSGSSWSHDASAATAAQLPDLGAWDDVDMFGFGADSDGFNRFSDDILQADHEDDEPLEAAAVAAAASCEPGDLREGCLEKGLLGCALADDQLTAWMDDDSMMDELDKTLVERAPFLDVMG